MPMKFDCALLETELSRVPARAKELEAVGCDGTFTFDGPHEPFLPLVLAAEHAPSLEIGTGVAIALARNPMVTAQLAYELHRYSRGKLTLGLGSQVRAHVEHRYGMPYERPVARMREYVLALRAIFDAFDGKEKLAFEGEFYRHTLLPPLFNPGKTSYGQPRIHLAGVNAKMVRAAAEVADGLLIHPFHTQRYVEQSVLPAVNEGLSRRRFDTSSSFAVCTQVLVVTGETREEIDQATAATRAQVAFYASTPAYRGVLEAEGYGDLQNALRDLTKTGRWSEMATCVDDTLVERVAYVGTPEEVAEKLLARCGRHSHRIAIATPFRLNDECARRLIAHYRKLEAARDAIA
jgi:probable F420-dependent oxidoreductase